jgi:hypothetical protein
MQLFIADDLTLNSRFSPETNARYAATAHAAREPFHRAFQALTNRRECADVA